MVADLRSVRVPILLRCSVGLACLLAMSMSPAASSRSSYVLQQIYDHNHRFAAELPQELAAKMQKMSASPFAFYRGTAHLFFKDVTAYPTAFLNTPASQTWLQGDTHPQISARCATPAATMSS